MRQFCFWTLAFRRNFVRMCFRLRVCGKRLRKPESGAICDEECSKL